VVVFRRRMLRSWLGITRFREISRLWDVGGMLHARSISSHRAELLKATAEHANIGLHLYPLSLVVTGTEPGEIISWIDT
jgi:hypothetical protein